MARKEKIRLRGTGATFYCPSCGHDRSRVMDSRPWKNWRRRRRQCDECTHRYTTYEVALPHHMTDREFKQAILAIATIEIELKRHLKSLQDLLDVK